MGRSMNVVPFKAPESFARFGIDGTRDAKTNPNDRYAKHI
jgi:hypothetical protein